MGDNVEIFERLSRIEQTAARIDERTKAHAAQRLASTTQDVTVIVGPQ